MVIVGVPGGPRGPTGEAVYLPTTPNM
jgi:hypothetical protein